MRQAARFYDPHGVEIREPTLIWADRLAISFFLLTGGLIGMVYAFWGMPGYFQAFEEAAASLTFALWVIFRVMDFLATGRIRHGTE